MMGDRSWQEWVTEYAAGHTHPINRATHTVGIPTVALSVILAPLAALSVLPWQPVAGLFVGGWVLQFIGHAYEGKPPEFFKDPRFLFVGLRWWFAKVSGRLSGGQARSGR